MATRIYALAKQLKMENTELLDICAKVGITGKGSALASLSEDEVAKVDSYLNGDQDDSTSEPSSRSRQESGGAISRSDYIPSRTVGKIKVLDSRKPASTSKKKGSEVESKLPTKKDPVVKLAEMPEIQQPVSKPKADEPKVQKPDIALPKDAITGRAGKSPPPLQRFTDQKKVKDKTTRPKTGVSIASLREAPSGKAGGGRSRTRAKDNEDADSRLGNLRDTRTKSRKTRTRTRQDDDDDGGQTGRRRGPRRPLPKRGPSRNTAAPRKENLTLEIPCSVRSFSEAAGMPAVKICFTLANLLSVPPNSLNINSQIDEETATLLAENLGTEIEFKQPPTLEELLIQQIEEQEDDADSLQPRPPVVTFLGHVDHGKTSLLDRIIGINVVDKEAGGITQHIEAYQIRKGGREISFVDTPGHEAFTEMRARGANVTDIAVLVVAADDGVMPQTEEAISHARAANVPIVVALNKMDLPGVDENKAMQDLASRELLPSEWGGDIEVIKTSAITGDGVDELLETLLLTADLHEYRANPNRRALGVCLEARQDADRGVVAKLIIKNGTLKVGDVVVCGSAYGRVKAMYDTLNRHQKTDEAGPSRPVNITGLGSAPQAGDKFYALDNIAAAREIAEHRAQVSRERSLSGITTKVSFAEFQERLLEGRLTADHEDLVKLNLIIKTDVRGSIEAIQKELGKIEHPEIQINTLHTGVGGITEADVTLAHASQAVIIGFNVIPDEMARRKQELWDVEIRRYDVIYKVTDDIKAILEGRLKPEERIVDLGHALVKEVFNISRAGSIAGCHVTGGRIERGCRIRVNRDGRTIGDYRLDSLKRHKDDAKEVPRGMECGIRLAGFDDVKAGDVLEAYKIEEVARSL